MFLLSIKKNKNYEKKQNKTKNKKKEQSEKINIKKRKSESSKRKLIGTPCHQYNVMSETCQ
jgi:hypothetical protein